MKQSEKDTQAINIRSEYYRQIEDIVSHSYQFNSVSEYVNYVLKQFLQADDITPSEQEKTELEQRLKDLGYL